MIVTNGLKSLIGVFFCPCLLLKNSFHQHCFNEHKMCFNFGKYIKNNHKERSCYVKLLKPL